MVRIKQSVARVGPRDRALGVGTITFEISDLWPKYFALWFIEARFVCLSVSY